jgi:hypothetical protein
MKSALFIRSTPLRLLVKIALWAAGSACLWWLTKNWGILDRPAGGLMAMVGNPAGWRRFLWLWAPMGLAFATLCGELIAAFVAEEIKRPWRWDWLSFVCLPALALASALDASGNNWALAVGAVYLLTLGFKASLALLMIWKASALATSFRLAVWGSVVIFFALYAGLGFWTCQAVSTAGDETRYIIEAEHLLQNFGLMQGQHARETYYWGRWSDVLGEPVAQSPLMKWFIAPGVGPAGRLGALFMLSIACALALGALAALGRELGFDVRASLLGAWALGGSAPLVQASQHIYPAAYGILGVALGLWLLAKTGPGRRLRVALALLDGTVMGLVKYRLGTAGIGLVFSSLAEWLVVRGRGRLVSAAVALMGCVSLLVLFLIIAEDLWSWNLGVWRFIGRYVWNIDLEWGRRLVSVPAMLFDQQFGLLPYAPWLGLGFIGMFAWRSYSRPILYHSLWLCACVLLPLIIYRWYQWDAGFTPPGRFLAPLLPVFAIWAWPVLQRPGGKAWRAVIAGLLGSSFFISLILALIPQWRYHRMTGVNNLLAWLGETFHSQVHRLFPGFIDYSWPDMLTALPWLALLAVVGIWFWRQGRGPVESPNFSQTDCLRGLGLVLAGLVLLIVLGRILPTWSLEAEAMQRKGATGLHGSYYTAPKLLLFNRPGARSWTQVVWPGGEREVVLMGYLVRGYDRQKEEPPILVQVALEGGSKAEVRFKPAGDRSQPHSLKLSAPPGWRRLEITYISGANQLALDRISVR